MSGMISTFGGYDDQYVGASEVIFDNGDIMVGGPLEQTYGSRETGSRYEYLFNVAANISDFVYIGATLGLTSLDYNYNDYFVEQAIDPSDFDITLDNNDKMYFKNNGELMELSNQEMIDSISWAGKRSFITNGKSYLEKVNLDNGTCYIAWRIKNVNVGSAGAYGTTTQGKVESISVRSLGVFSATDAASHSGDVFQQKNANEYYLPIDGKLKKVTNLKHLYKLYPEHKDAIKEYVDKEKIKMNEPLSVLQVLNYCMGLK
jgi:hypothetical protein